MGAFTCDWCQTGRSPSQCCDSPVTDKLATDQSQGALEGVRRSCLRFLSQKNAIALQVSLKVIARSSFKTNRKAQCATRQLVAAIKKQTEVKVCVDLGFVLQTLEDILKNLLHV